MFTYVLRAHLPSNPRKVKYRGDMRIKGSRPEDIPEIGEGCGLRWQILLIPLDFIRRVACVLR